jgi:hypothetical protein
MAHSTTARARPRSVRVRRARRAAWPPRLRAVRRLVGWVLAAPLAVRLIVATLVVVALWSAANWMYQVMRKPTELFFPVSGSLAKTPTETWRQYGPLFREHSTAVITPELLAALAQVEGAGNPVARTYWRWRVSWNPFEVYRPASSAVGMFQLTDATFREARRYCVHDHVVVEEGRWNDPRACWFNGLYTRVVPSHAVELTAALLDRQVARALQRRGVSASLRQQHDLAGDLYVQRGLRLVPAQRCGDHDVARYLAQINGLKRQFLRLAETG